MDLSPLSAAAHNGTRTGSISGGKLGTGSYTRTATTTGNVTTVDSTSAYASGKTTSDTVTITRNADGSVTRDSTYTRPNGKTGQRDITLGASQNGVRTITGTQTGPNGAVDQIAGTRSRQLDGVDSSITLTNQSGLTAVRNDLVWTSGSITTSTITGTNFSGGQIAEQLIQTSLTG